MGVIMIKRTYTTFTKANGQKSLAVTIDIAGGEILASFLHAEMGAFSDIIMENFQRVLTMNSEQEEFQGNFHRIVVGIDNTKIYSLNDETENNALSVSTKDMYDLLQEWQEKASAAK